jgi:chlorophyllide a hydrolase
VDVQLDKSASLARHESAPTAPRHPERLIGIYWLLSVLVGTVFLWDWLTSWNVGATLASPMLVIYLCCSFALSQVLYVLVARHNGRPVHGPALAVFAIGNGFAETLAFAVIYRAGEIFGAWSIGLIAPGLASVAGFLVGVIFFAIYGGLIHGLFWLRVLPPHLDDNSLSRKIRKARPVAEVALVLGWSLCLWLYRDIWTVIFFHTLVDIGLMLLVRPAIFGASE